MQNDCKIISTDKVEVMCPGPFEFYLGKIIMEIILYYHNQKA